MTVNEVLRCVAALGTDAGENCIRAVTTETVSPTSPFGLGRMTAREALALHETRKQTLMAAGVDFKGVDELLSVLRNLPSDHPIRLAGFVGLRRSFVVFIDEGGNAIGCVQVEKGTA